MFPQSYRGENKRKRPGRNVCAIWQNYSQFSSCWNLTASHPTCARKITFFADVRFFIIIIFSSFTPYLRTHVFNLSWKYVFDSRRRRPRQMSLERLAKLFLCLPAGLLAAAEIIFINLSRWASPPRDKKRPRPCMKQCFGHFVCVSKISLLMAPN